MTQLAASSRIYRQRRAAVGTAAAVLALVGLSLGGSCTGAASEMPAGAHADADSQIVRLGFFAAVGGGSGSADAASAGVQPVADYVVQPGDTLWSIAKSLQPDKDPRALVHRLTRQAGGSVLLIGQRLDLTR